VWVVRPVAASAGRAALRQGKPAVALAAFRLARQPATHGLLALIAIATALAGQAVIGFATADRAYGERARIELGADRVIHIGQTTDSELLSVVRRADPDGRWAMAVSRGGDPDAPVLAIQSDRLAAVANWPSAATATPDQVSARLRPATNRAMDVGGAGLTLDAEVIGAGTGPATLTVHIVTRDGAWTTAAFELVRGTGRRSYDAPISTCDSGCRIAWLELPANVDGLRLYGLSSAGDFSSPGRWRADAPNAVMEYGPDFLAVSDARALRPADAPWPLPVVAAGDPSRQSGGAGEFLGVLGTRLPVDVTATASLLPGLGGSGTVVDYEFADRVAAGGAHPAENAEVWLNRDAPATVVDAIRTLLNVQADESVEDRAAKLSQRGTGRIFQLQLLAAGVGIATAIIGFVALALAERPQRHDECVALRVQGVRRRTASFGAVAGYVALVVSGIVVGVLACVPTLLVTRAALPVFADGWTATTAPWWPW
jgi:hypothetical protein